MNTLKRGVVIKIGDNEDLLKACIKGLPGEDPSEFLAKQNKRSVILKKFDELSSPQKKWCCLKAEAGKKLELVAKKNWGMGAGEAYIDPGHWCFIEGEDFRLIESLIF